MKLRHSSWMEGDEEKLRELDVNEEVKEKKLRFIFQSDYPKPAL